MVVSHPAVGAGVQAVLGLERRWDLRRAAKLSEAVDIARRWPADAALVDAAMLATDRQVDLGVPATVLAAGDAEGTAAAARLDRPRGWIAKDAPASEFVSAVERLLTGGGERSAGIVAQAAIGLLIVVLVALLTYLVWVAIS